MTPHYPTDLFAGCYHFGRTSSLCLMNLSVFQYSEMNTAIRQEQHARHLHETSFKDCKNGTIDTPMNVSPIEKSCRSKTFLPSVSWSELFCIGK
jgi:hypothetical protein